MWLLDLQNLLRTSVYPPVGYGLLTGSKDPAARTDVQRSSDQPSSQDPPATHLPRARLLVPDLGASLRPAVLLCAVGL